MFTTGDLGLFSTCGNGDWKSLCKSRLTFLIGTGTEPPPPPKHWDGASYPPVMTSSYPFTLIPDKIKRYFFWKMQSDCSHSKNFYPSRKLSLTREVLECDIIFIIPILGNCLWHLNPYRGYGIVVKIYIR